MNLLYQDLKNDTRRFCRKQRRSMIISQHRITIEMAIICFWEWISWWKIICCSSMTWGFQPVITKRSGISESIKENKSKLWHSEVKNTMNISVMAWACWLWCAEIMRTCITACQRYWMKENPMVLTEISLNHRVYSFKLTSEPMSFTLEGFRILYLKSFFLPVTQIYFLC